jgi:hypothetical protein
MYPSRITLQNSLLDNLIEFNYILFTLTEVNTRNSGTEGQQSAVSSTLIRDTRCGPSRQTY